MNATDERVDLAVDLDKPVICGHWKGCDQTATWIGTARHANLDTICVTRAVCDRHRRTHDAWTDRAVASGSWLTCKAHQAWVYPIATWRPL